jgi:hypothetical protein
MSPIQLQTVRAQPWKKMETFTKKEISSPALSKDEGAVRVAWNVDDSSAS